MRKELLVPEGEMTAARAAATEKVLAANKKIEEKFNK